MPDGVTYDFVQLHDLVALVRMGPEDSTVAEIDLASARRLRDRLDHAISRATTAITRRPWWAVSQAA